MRLFLHIFSIYILALSVMPCSDASNDCKKNITVSQRTEAHITIPTIMIFAAHFVPVPVVVQLQV